jgi:hypothetical protein
MALSGICFGWPEGQHYDRSVSTTTGTNTTIGTNDHSDAHDDRHDRDDRDKNPGT